MASGASLSPSSQSTSTTWTSRLKSSASAAAARVASLPPVTLAFSTLLVASHVVRLSLRIPVLAWCLDVKRVLKKGQLWRLATSPLDHVGVFHLLFNLWALVPCAEERERERRDGGPGVLSLELSFLTLASGVLFVGGGEALHDLLDDASISGGGGRTIKIDFPRPACAAGASGIAFGLINAAAGSPGAPARIDVGGLSAPGRVRPWMLALAVQLMVPEASLAGHVAGLLTGEAVSWARRNAGARERVSRAGRKLEEGVASLFAAVASGLGCLPRLARSGGGGGGSGGGGIGASLLPVVVAGGGGDGDSNNSDGRGGGLAARLAALFGGRRTRGGGWQPVPGEEAPRGRTTGGGGVGGGETTTTTTMSPAEAARAAAEARAAAAASSASASSK